MDDRLPAELRRRLDILEQAVVAIQDAINLLITEVGGLAEEAALRQEHHGLGRGGLTDEEFAVHPMGVRDILRALFRVAEGP